MSLINQMLQELDARRADAPGTGSFGEQVRAVRETERKPYLLWGAGALAVVAVTAGAGAWFWLHTQAPAVAVAPPPVNVSPAPVSTPTPPAAPAAPVTSFQPADLPLKIDAGLSAAPASVPSTTAAAASGAEPAGVTTSIAVRQQGSAPVAPLPATEVRPETAAVPAGPASGGKAGNGKASAKKENASPAATELEVKHTAQHGDDPAPAFVKQVKEQNPQQRAENEYRKGVSALQQGKTSDAVSSLEQALQLDPMHAPARQTLIGILVDRNYKDAALRRAREGLSIDAAQPGLAMIAARLQLEKGEQQPAIDTLERTLPYAVDRPDYQAFLAALLQRAERHKEAVEHYFAALQKNPQNGVWWMGAGISLQADRRKAEAIEAFKRAKVSNSLTPQLVEFVDSQLAQLQQR